MKIATYCPFCKSELVHKSTMSSYCPQFKVAVYIAIKYTKPDSPLLEMLVERE